MSSRVSVSGAKDAGCVPGEQRHQRALRAVAGDVLDVTAWARRKAPRRPGAAAGPAASPRVRCWSPNSTSATARGRRPGRLTRPGPRSPGCSPWPRRKTGRIAARGRARHGHGNSGVPGACAPARGHLAQPVSGRGGTSRMPRPAAWSPPCRAAGSVALARWTPLHSWSRPTTRSRSPLTGMRRSEQRVRGPKATAPGCGSTLPRAEERRIGQPGQPGNVTGVQAASARCPCRVIAAASTSWRPAEGGTRLDRCRSLAGSGCRYTFVELSER